MKSTRLLLTGLFVSFLGFALARAMPASAITFGIPDIAFKQKFKGLVEKTAKPAELEKAVKQESSTAGAWIVRSNEVLFERPDDADSAAFLTALSAAWKGAMKSAFADKEKAFFTALEGKNKTDRVDLRKRFDKGVSDFEANAEKKDSMTYANLVDEFELFANAFDQIGDAYFSSEAWIYYAACYDEPQRGASAEPKRAALGLEKAIAARAKIELNDQRNDEITKRLALLAKGAEKAAPASGKDEPGAAPTDAGAPITVPLAFEVVPTFDMFVRPLYTADDAYVLWPSIRLAKNASTGTFENNTRPPGGPVFSRIGAADVRADVDGDGKWDGALDVKVPLTGNITPVRVQLGKGPDARPWAFLAVPGTQAESFQGVQMNLAPTGDRMTIYTLSAASVIGTLEGTEIRIIDDSMDGVYGTLQTSQNAFQFDGISKNNYQPELDCIVIGTSKRARPWSEFQEIAGKWYKLEQSTSGKELKATPVKLETGVVKLDYKGPTPPAWVILRGSSETKDSFFDLVEGGTKGVTVPAGRYTLFYGEVRKGKKRQAQKALILPSKTAASIDVTKGATTIVTLGAPFTLEYKSSNIDGKISIDGKSVVVVGSAGERYERPWQCVVHSEAAWRKKGTKQPSKYERMGLIRDPEVVNKTGWAALWFPLDLDLDIKGQGEVEVQIVDRKHPLFGAVESEWK